MYFRNVGDLATVDEHFACEMNKRHNELDPIKRLRSICVSGRDYRLSLRMGVHLLLRSRVAYSNSETVER